MRSSPASGRSARPSSSLRARRIGSDGHRERQEGDERPGSVTRARPDGERDPHEGEAIEQAGPAPSETYGQGLFPRLGVRCDVAQVVGLEQSRRQQAHGHSGPEPNPSRAIGEQVAGQTRCEWGVLDVGRARGGHEPEEDEDEELAEAEIAVGAGTSGVAPSGDGRRRRPSGTSHHVTRGRQDQAGHSGDRRRRSRAAILTCAHRGQLAGHEPDRSDPVLVRAPHPVGVVIDVVGPDLDAESDRAKRGAR